ncbi:MAG: MAE_28990/MAE_18760 family HEPN-like nuclease [Arcicella sp.]|jgi:hypothetical protein|nr:MAE_28990/MAE_18760 family HEPN-like nuclease [Arcicella sp.]
MPINLSAKPDFDNTKKEIEKYLTFLQHVENGDLILKNSIFNVEEGFSIDTELTNILKANTFLLLYNLVESTIRNLLWDIWRALQQDGVEYSQLVEEIKRILIERKISLDFYSNNNTITNQVMQVLNAVFSDLSVLHPSEKRDIFLEGGNLGFTEIQKTFKKYGIRNITQNHSSQPEYFNKTKANRNHLAHGEKTFKECGRDYTYAELKEYNNSICEFLERVIGIVEVYIQNKNYKNI